MSADTAPPPIPSKPANRDRIVAVVLAYAVSTCLWILLSDRLVQMIFSEPDHIILASVFKGWLFVGVTSLLLYSLMRRWFVDDAAAKSSSIRSRRLGLPFALLATAIIVLTGAGIVNSFMHYKAIEVARLQTIADLKTRQLADWLRDKQDDADFIQTSAFFVEQFSRWQTSGDLGSGERLQTRLEQLRQSHRLGAITLLDPNANKLWGSDKSPQVIAAPLQAAAQLASAERKVRRVGPYRGVAGHTRLDFVVPLTAMPGPAPLIVLHIDLSDWFFSSLHIWPVPSTSGEMVLFRRDGDQLLYLNELRHQKDTAAKLRLPMSAEKLLTAQVLRGEFSQDRPLDGVDYRSIPVIGVVRAVAGTNWFLLTKLDQSELYAEAIGETVWISLTGLLALFIAVVGFYLLRQQQQLALAQAVQQSQAERLHALQLLAAIGDSSDDAIFAKDLDGRFILFNRAASQFVGKPAEEVLGHDERCIFPTEQANILIAISHQVITENRIDTREELIKLPDGEHFFLTTKGPLRDKQDHVIGVFGIARDITERKRAETALRASELSYRTLFENMMNSVVHARVIFHGETPVDLEYISTNPAFAVVTGITEPVVGRRISEIIPSYCENNPESLETFGRVAATGVSTRWEHYLCELGRWFSFMIYSPVYGEVIIVTENITDRKQAELTLQASERRFFDIVSASADWIWEIDAVGRYIYVSDNVQDLLGYTAAEIIGKTPFDLMAPDEAQRVSSQFADICAQREPFRDLDNISQHKDGSLRYVQTNGMPILDADGNLLGYRGLDHDITEHKLDEQAKRRQTEELAQRNAELERFNRAMVGRELDMIALKQRINALSRQLGREPPYPLTFHDDASAQQKPEDAQ